MRAIRPWASYPAIFCHISKHSQQISGRRSISYILAKSFIHSIIVYNKTYLHFHVTSLYLFKIFSTTVIVSLGQYTTWPKGKTPTLLGVLPQAVCLDGIFFLPMKWSRHGIKENNIIYCKIIANYSTKETNNHLASMALNYINLGENLARSD